MKPLIQIIDCSTGENITREMNDEEYAQWLKDTGQENVEA
jgi:hypothetical protein